MITSRDLSFLDEIAQGLDIPDWKLAYLNERAVNQMHDFVLRKFLEKEAAGQLTKAQLARRIGKHPSQITRILSSPANWTISTANELLIGIGGEALKPAASPLLNQAPALDIEQGARPSPDRTYEDALRTERGSKAREPAPQSEVLENQLMVAQ